MTAEETFKELGYVRKEDDYFISYVKKSIVTYTFYFSKEYKTVEVVPTFLEGIHYFTRIDAKLLRAINKQVEELGWNE